MTATQTRAGRNRHRRHGSRVWVLTAPPQGHGRLRGRAWRGRAGMNHPFMATVAARLQERGIATLRFHPTWSAVASGPIHRPSLMRRPRRNAARRRRLPKLLCLRAANRSRPDDAQAQAIAPIEGVRGLAFVGFPLHCRREAVADRAETSLQRDNSNAVPAGDARCARRTGRACASDRGLKDRATLREFADADHSFHVPAIGPVRRRSSLRTYLHLPRRGSAIRARVNRTICKACCGNRTSLGVHSRPRRRLPCRSCSG